MATFLSSSQATRLQKIARRYKDHVILRKPWNRRNDDELWRVVLSQVVVPGKAEPGDRLQYDPRTAARVSIKRLKRFRTDAELQKYLHRIFSQLGVRYVGRSWRSDWKAAAAVWNFRCLTEKGTTPRKFFEWISRCPREREMVERLQEELKYYGNKGARDTLIELGLAKNCMALDARIYGLLARVGVKVSPEDIYLQIERELIKKVATPLNVSGARLDRILFQNYRAILGQL